MWCEELKIKNNLAEISQNFTFPHFPFFEIFAHKISSKIPTTNHAIEFGEWKFDIKDFIFVVLAKI